MRRGSAVALLTLLGAGGLQAQHQWGWQLHGMGTVVVGERAPTSDGGEQFWGVGGAVAVRNAGRFRAATLVSVGDLDGDLGVRGELALSLYLNPFKRTGLTPYGGGGVAAVVSRDGSAEYVLLLLGVEANPGGGSGWFAEGGVGGGLRFAAGVRKRWRRAVR